MNFERIDRLVAQEDFFFQAWTDRYGKGVWAALGVRETQVDTVRDLSSDGDLVMIPAMAYVFSADWLPYVTGKTLYEAMQKLEERLATLPEKQLCRGSLWADLVSKAIEALSDESYAELPATFEQAAARASEADKR